MKMPINPFTPPFTIIGRAFGMALVRDQQSNFALIRDPQGAALHFPGGMQFNSNLTAQVIRANGRQESPRNLGSGLVTNVGVLAMANDFGWSAQLNLATLALANQHAWGTGTTAAAATDILLKTFAVPTNTTAVTGTQTLVSAANSQIYQTVATIVASGSVAITEWGLFTAQTSLNGSTTGSPFTGATAATWTDTGSAQTASSATVRGLQQTIVVPGTTAVWGLNLSNTTHVGTIPAWYKVADGTAGSTPGSTETFAVYPVMWDHKVFAAINLNTGDAIAFTYKLAISSGG